MNEVKILKFPIQKKIFLNYLRNQKVSYILATDWLHKKSTPQMRRDVFQAIADPTRREIINMIAHQILNLNAVAEKFRQSRPAISKHIKILTECGLLTIKQVGRERHCEAKLQKLNEVSDWVEQYKKFWNTKLDTLEIYLSELQEKGESGKVKTAARKEKEGNLKTKRIAKKNKIKNHDKNK